jgi:hypothetical protein
VRRVRGNIVQISIPWPGRRRLGSPINGLYQGNSIQASMGDQKQGACQAIQIKAYKVDANWHGINLVNGTNKRQHVLDKIKRNTENIFLKKIGSKLKERQKQK